jgi:cyclophilin family peptidyl-prolyl cis-trans isomerase
MNSPSPVVATTPPLALDEAESQKQVVVLETSLGRIVIELDDVSAPRTCGNFRKLVSDGFYNRTTFHRVIPSFMIQGGDPNSKSDDRATYGQGDPGYTLPAEIKLKHVAGAVAMARLPDSANPQRDSNGSQFFICVADCPSLDDQYTVFGHVIKGMDAANQIANQPRDKRDDPVTRIEMAARLESKKQALEESTAGP